MKLSTKDLTKAAIYISVFLFLLFITIKLPMINTSPDSRLYIGLAKNIAEGTGYVDNIRDSNVLPPIGHPLLVSAFFKINDNPIVFTRFFIFLSFIILMLTIKTVFPFKWTVVISFAIPLILWKQKIWIAAGVESSLFFVNSLLVLTVVSMISSGREKKIYNYLILGILIFFSLIIRPILWSGMLLAIPISLVVLLNIRDLQLNKKYCLSMKLRNLVQELGINEDKRSKRSSD